MKIRTITVKGVAYIRCDDVEQMFREFGESEETDTRERCEQVARLIRKEKANVP